MNIKNNILKACLKQCYFINGTAYAGKSTMCRMLAEKYHLLLCGENYGLDRLLQIITPEEQPNLSYFNTMKDWQEFVNRTPDEYLAWIRGNGYEAADFEIAELIRLSGDRKTIVDTNIPLDILRQSPDPEKTMGNFRKCIAAVNSREIYDEWLNSGFFTIIREDEQTDTRLETMEVLARHFGLIYE